MVDGPGTIVACGPEDKIPIPHICQRKHFPGRILVPGLVDLHTHLPQFEMPMITGKTFLEWLEQHVYPWEKSFDRKPDRDERIERFFHRLARCGTTTACVISSASPETTEAAFRVAERSGLRVILGKSIMDYGVPKPYLEKTERAIEDSLRLCKSWHGKDRGRLQYAFVPRSPSGCTLGLLKEVVRLAREHQAYIHTHVAECPQDKVWLHWAHPQWKDYRDWIRETDLGASRSILAHGIHLTPEELAIFRGRPFGIAHCPASNLALGSGILDVWNRLDRGIPVGLGSDVAGGPDLSIFEQMRMSLWASKAALLADHGNETNRPDRPNGRSGGWKVLDAAAALYLGTLGGAKALGLEKTIGNFKAGKDADFLVLERPRIEQDDPTGELVLNHLVYHGSERLIEEVVVLGKRISPAQVT